MHFNRKAFVAIALALTISFAPSLADELDDQLRSAQEDLATQLINVRLQLALYDQINRVQVAQGVMAASTTDSLLSTKAAELVARPVTQDDITQLQAQHRQGFQAWHTQLSNKINLGARWPEGEQAAWKSMAEKTLQGASKTYEAIMAESLDPRAVMDDLALVQAWTDGTEGFGQSPFIGQKDRIANAIPVPIAREMVTAIATPEKPEAGSTTGGMTEGPNELPTCVCVTEPCICPPTTPDKDSKPQIQVLEYDMDRPGSDVANFELSTTDGPEQCLAACQSTGEVCQAFTYVKAGVQGPKPRCWLKNTVPQATPNTCCVSGVLDPSFSHFEGRQDEIGTPPEE